MKATEAVLDQFELIWAFAELHLDALVEADFLWRPAEVSWTVHRDAHGAWRPDWSDAEPDPIPVPTIAWLTWQMTWWWATAGDDLAGRALRRRDDVLWPGTGAAVIEELRALASRWRDMLGGLTEDDLGRASSFPWSADAGRIVADTVLWVNVELTKNLSELGQLRLLRSASTT